MPPPSPNALALAFGAAAGAAILVLIWRRRNLVRSEATATYGELTVRSAVHSDLPHLLTISELSGQAIVPEGGDYVRFAWEHEWWVIDPRLHYNDFAFVDDLAVAFARVECYGRPESPESGFLEGMRVHPDYMGKRVMSRLQAHLLRRIPAAVREHLYLAVGSTNDVMRRICEPRYQYLGAFCLHAFDPRAMLRADRERYAAKLVLGPIDGSSREAAWAFLTAHPLHAAEPGRSKLLLPGRFYAFRALTLQALDEKIASGRAFMAMDGDAIVAAFFAFDTDLPPVEQGAPVRRLYTCCVEASLDAGRLGSALLAFARSRPPLEVDSGLPLQTIVSIGPHDNSKPGSTGDVEPRFVQGLAAAAFTRSRGTHLRVYRVP